MKRFFDVVNDAISLLSRPAVVRGSPIHIYVEPTTHCNYGCIMCSNRFIKNKSFMGLLQFKKSFDTIKPLRVSFVGIGEPLLNPNIFDMIRHAKMAGSSTGMTTNGSLITPNIANKIVESGLDMLTISVDGATKKTYEKIRKGGDFFRLREGLRNIVSAKAKRHARKPTLRLRTVVMRENLDELCDILKFAKKNSVNLVYFFVVFPTDRTAGRGPKLVEKIEPSKFKEKLLEAAHFAKMNGIKINVEPNIDMFEEQLKIQLEGMPPRRICIHPWSSLIVRANGDVQPCCLFDIPGKEGVMGNLFEKSFNSVWNGEDYRKFRKDMKNGKRVFMPCKNCLGKDLGFVSTLVPFYR